MTPTSSVSEMSNLYRSTIHARISKLPSLPPELEEGNEEDEASDSLGTLPISMGPPSTQVFDHFSLISVFTPQKLSELPVKGVLACQILRYPLFLPLVSSTKRPKSQWQPPGWISAFIIVPRNTRMGQS